MACGAPSGAAAAKARNRHDAGRVFRGTRGNHAAPMKEWAVTTAAAGKLTGLLQWVAEAMRGNPAAAKILLLGLATLWALVFVATAAMLLRRLVS
jgi:hypothetical protein